MADENSAGGHGDAAETSEGTQWRDCEVLELLNIWGDKAMQAKLEGSYRNRAVFETIAKALADRGYTRSWLQCQRKVKSLHAKYKEAMDANKRSGRRRVTCPHYDLLDRILGDKPRVDPTELLLDSAEEACTEAGTDDSAGHAARADSPTNSHTGDGPASLSPGSPGSIAEETQNSRATDAPRNSSASTSIGSAPAKTCKRKSKMESTLEVFADRISKAFKAEDDLLLKLQAAQHEHDRRMFQMFAQFMDRQPPQPHYQAPIYNPNYPHHSRAYPMSLSPSPTQPFLQDLNQPLPHAFHPQDHPPSFRPEDE
ncbi:uncharacterized protein LOC132889127 [Neoarius graeffei]|uniref:uncharacterized protein LOC132889127 n=1 Tax=Neoarius graeffei TaxID=443677 RepID=UPI00298D2DCD|nr:uncharacterized protein LOC132889127 [Neoarius graeffei]XP_060781304.1 uncharacterized protein LOC132889127 [Neoarius graeffei]XP_060781305.1 uncharacterized protein LOC132889127 [Neoarius graeffei]